MSPSSETIKKFEASLQIIKNQFCKLQWDLDLKENYIKYLENNILIRDKELNSLQQKISDIKEYSITTAPILNNIVDYLNKIFDADERLEKLVLEIYLQANACKYNENIDIFISQLSSYLAGTELHNIFANYDQADINALWRCTMAQMNTSNSFRNPSIAYDYANTVDNNAVTIGVSMIPAKAFTKDWHLARGYLSDRPANAVNADNANSIVFGDIQIGQAIY
ncbi:590_t:CDS:2 [Cetraspora pellucida]|uniref:590_t:CDS:1 n=1 Tax=Cetraspora pellucida TaxID=1433469 RepID=A0A9N9FKS3_9GLOM|nr:590_t:CDS:2 [Cetraspora pellucida]